MLPLSLSHTHTGQKGTLEKSAQKDSSLRVMRLRVASAALLHIVTKVINVYSVIAASRAEPGLTLITERCTCGLLAALHLLYQYYNM